MRRRGWGRGRNWGEQGEMRDPKGGESSWRADMAFVHSIFVDGQTKVAERGGAGGERCVRTSLQDEDVSGLKGKFRFYIGGCIKPECVKTFEGPRGIIDKYSRSARGILVKASRIRGVHKLSYEIPTSGWVRVKYFPARKNDGFDNRIC